MTRNVLRDLLGATLLLALDLGAGSLAEEMCKQTQNFVFMTCAFCYICLDFNQDIT